MIATRQSSKNWAPSLEDGAFKCNDEETTATTSRSRRRVSFGSIVIRDYSVTLGDNPCCSYGNPVQLDWSYNERGTFAVEEYEDARLGRPRRSVRQMVLTSYDRRDMLKDAGFSLTEMQRALRSVNIAKRQRAASLVMKPASQVSEVLLGASSRMKKILFRKRRRGQELTHSLFL